MAVNKILYLDLIISILTFLYVAADNGVNNTMKCPVNKFVRKQVPAEPLNDMCMGDVVMYLSKALHSIIDKELSISSFQEMINELEFINIADNLNIQLSLLVDKFNNKLRLLFDILKQSYNIIYPILSKTQDQSVYFNQMIELDIISKRIPNICSQIITALATHLKNQKWKDLHVLPMSQPSAICGPSTMIHNIGPLLLSHYCPQKNIILLLDTYMSEPDLSVAQLTAKTIIDMLSEADNVSVVSLGNSIPVLCKDGLLKATDINKFQLVRYIDSLAKLDMNQTMNVDFKKLTQFVKDEIIIIHLTNKLTKPPNVQKIFEIISEKFKTYFKTILIRSKTSSHTENKQTLNNDTIILPTQNVLGYEIGKLFSCLQCSNQQKKDYYILDPYFEPYSKSIMLSISQITSTAILSLDVNLSEFLDDLTYFNAGPNVHVIVFDSKGVVWIHKDFPRNEKIMEQPLKVHLQDIENINSQTVMKMTSDVQGIVHMKTKLGEQKWYRWKRLIYEDLIVCITSITEEGILPVAKIVPLLPKNILHYRLDLMIQNGIDKDIFCIYRNRILTLSTGVVYLSPWCFQSPIEQLKLLETSAAMTIQSYMAYIKDLTGLLANPGLRPSVKSDVAILAQSLENFKEQHNKSLINKFVLRRYSISTSSGVLEIFPGMVLDSCFDPKRRIWYGKALEHPDKIILTPPYLDGAGSGYVVTLSQAIRYSIKNNKSADNVIAVVSMDVTMSYISRLLLDMFPFCSEATVRCFLMDDKGYLISHPTFLETTDKVEQHHLTHKEILIANDILNHELFVKKQLCVNYLDGTLRRYYQFNMSLDEVLTNIAHGEHCVKYQIAAVPGTNMFLGIINMTTQCNHLRAFCPCSTMDHSCLNCKSMEQTGCECPCECSLYSPTCKQQNIDNLHSCPPLYEQGASSQMSSWMQSENLQSCPIIDCKSYMTERDCLGIADCQWCHIDSDGETRLQQPFCSDLSVCFRGIFGSLIPYSSYNSQSTNEITLRDWPSVGPVAGGILAVVLTLGIILFCYKLRSMHSSLDHQCFHVHTSPDTLRMTHIEGDPEPTEFDQTKNMGCLVKDGIAPVSPYKVSTNYRRPPGGDSDHGYSTMTPHDDFEQQPFASEPLLVIDNIEPDLNKQSNIPSPTTHLESPHHVLVPVTVHRDMETNYC